MLLRVGLLAVVFIAVQLGLSSSANILQSQGLNKRQRNHEDLDQAATREYYIDDQQSPQNYELFQTRLTSPMESLIDPMKTAASHYHHKKGAKGWLDMGAWTKKKGAFGWYADYPVGKG